MNYVEGYSVFEFEPKEARICIPPFKVEYSCNAYALLRCIFAYRYGKVSEGGLTGDFCNFMAFDVADLGLNNF